MTIAEALMQAFGHHQAGRFPQAEQLYRAILRANPRHHDALHLIGMVAYSTGRGELAIEYMREALRSKPEFPEANNNLGNILLEHGKIDEAIANYREAIRLRPEYAEAHSNLGNGLKDLGRLPEAEACYREALRFKPDYAGAHNNLGRVCLQAGKFEEGWAEYEWRWRCEDFTTKPLLTTQPAWDGSSFPGRTLYLYAEQGLGDTLQFVRYAPLVKERGGRVIVGCYPPLVRLLQTCPGIDQVVDIGMQPPPFDLHASLLSLPAILGTTAASIPAAIPYLAAETDLVRSWGARLAAIHGFRVGIVWQGNPRQWSSQFRAADERRSFPLAQFEALARLPNVKLISLQKDFGREQLSRVADRFHVIDLGDMLSDFTDTAAVMKNLDLVISADTSPVHLAGALGIPVWVPLPFAACWRWLQHRTDSPWYPTMRLFRQKEIGKWDEVFRCIAGELEKKVK